MKIIAWNINKSAAAWRELLQTDADVALLQEAMPPPMDIHTHIEVDAQPWRTAGSWRRPWRAAVVRLSERVTVEWLVTKALDEASGTDLPVSRMGTLAAAVVKPARGEQIVVASMYGAWETAHHSTARREIYADASVHRVISDLSALILKEQGHRIVAAGDLNILHGYGENANPYWGGRYRTVFERMDALGMTFVGPRAPDSRQANPWPIELPKDSPNVPTHFRSGGGRTPDSATRQLDFVFASRDVAASVHARALNAIDTWGPSDHCMVEIVVD